MIYLIPFICAILYASGGSDYCGTSVRKYPIPCLLLINSCIPNGVQLYSVLSALLMVLVLSLGYGESAWLRKLVKGSNLWTRSIISVLLAVSLFGITNNLLSLIIIPWYVYLTTFCKKDDFEVKGLLTEEMLIGLGIGIMGVL